MEMRGQQGGQEVVINGVTELLPASCLQAGVVGFMNPTTENTNLQVDPLLVENAASQATNNKSPGGPLAAPGWMNPRTFLFRGLMLDNARVADVST